MSTPFSILDIGRRINSLSVAYCDLSDAADEEDADEHRPDPVQFKSRRERQARMNSMLSEMSLLRDLALIPQPRTLVEAAVQLSLLVNTMSYELDTDDIEKMRAGFKKTHRTTAGIARSVAAAADVDLTQFGELDTVSLMHSLCPPEPTEQDRAGEQTDRVKW